MSFSSSDTPARPAGASRSSLKTTLASALVLIALPAGSFAADTTAAAPSQSASSPSPLTPAADAKPATSSTTPNEPEVVKLDSLAVVEKQSDTLAPINAAKVQLSEIAGTTSLVNVADVQRGRASNAEDLLSYQPGVFAQATSGNSANKISIRGSGLNTFYQGYSLGTKYLYDGQSVTGPGGTQEEFLSAPSVSFIEILNGPNAFNYASTSLGGAINFVTHTGYTAPGVQARAEVGGFGYDRQELSYGGVVKKFDYFVSVENHERDGFQTNTPNEGNAVVVNLGYKFNEHLDTRLIVHFLREELVNGSTLSKQQIEDTPDLTRVVGTVGTAAQSARKKPSTSVVTSKTTYTFDNDSKLEFGLSNTNYMLQNGWLYSKSPQDWRSNDVNTTIRYLRNDEIFDRDSKTTLIFSDTRILAGDVHGYADPRTGAPRVQNQYTDYTGSADTVLAASNDFEAFKDTLWITSGLSYASIDRDIRILKSTLVNDNTSNPAHYDQSVTDVDGYLLPRFGARYKVNKSVQLFSSVSKAVDGPVTWQMGSTGSPYVRPLKAQEATTLEAGIRTTGEVFEGSLTVYRAWLKNELLTVTDPLVPTSSPLATINTNASPTIHQGIELGLTAKLWKNSTGDKLSLRQSYTLNDFYFENDSKWGKNDLPSIPTNVYQAELLYQHSTGFYAGINARAASNYYVDFANSVEASPYVIFGTKIGYETPHWSVFLDLRNITDKHYATASNTVANAGGALGQPTAFNFYPGDTFNAIAGVSFRF